MRSVLFTILAAASLAACGDPIAEQARIDTRRDPVRADTMLAVGFAHHLAAAPFPMSGPTGYAAALDGTGVCPKVS